MNAKAKRKEYLLVALTLLALALAAAVANRWYFRADLTSSRSFTLSEATRGIKNKLAERVRLTYYLSDNLAKQEPSVNDITDLLRELEAVSDGKIAVDVVPVSDDAQRREAESSGIQSLTLNKVDNSEFNIATAYAGVAVRYLDRVEAIPVVNPGSFEYDLYKAIDRVVRDAPQAVGVLSGLSPDGSGSSGFDNVVKILANTGFDARTLERGKPVPEDVEAIFVFDSGSLDDYDLYYIDRFVAGGGNAFFAVQSVDVMLPMFYVQKAQSRAIFELLSSWGFSIGDDLVLDKQCLRQISRQTIAGQERGMLVDYPQWIIVNSKNMAVDRLPMRGLNYLIGFWPSSLTVKEAPGLSYDVLASTTDESWLMTDNLVASPEQEALFYMQQAEAKKRPLVVAASGIFPSKFGALPPPARPGVAESPSAPPDAAPGKVVVMPSAASFKDQIWNYIPEDQAQVQVIARSNYEFLIAMADWLSSGEEALSIRARIPRDQRLSAIENKGLFDFAVFMTYAIVLGVVPILVAVFGIARMAKRKRREMIPYERKQA